MSSENTCTPPNLVIDETPDTTDNSEKQQPIHSIKLISETPQLNVGDGPELIVGETPDSNVGKTPDLIYGELSDSFINGSLESLPTNNMVFSTPILKSNQRPPNKKNHRSESRLFSAKNLDYDKDDRLSPATADIMNTMYGEVWKNTPGLFKKTKTVDKKEKSRFNIDEVLKKLDSLNLYVKSLTDVKIKKVTSKHKHHFETDAKRTEPRPLNDTLKPKMLSFEDEFDRRESDKYRVKNLNDVVDAALPDLIPCPDLDDSDLIMSVKKVRKKNVLLISSSENSDNEQMNNSYYERRQQSDTDGENTKHKIRDKIKTKKNRVSVQIDSRLDCSIILIESDDGNDKTSTAKKTRKLYSRRNVFYENDEVQFVSEETTTSGDRWDGIVEIVDGTPSSRSAEKNNMPTKIRRDIYNYEEVEAILIKDMEAITLKDVLKPVDDVAPKFRLDDKKNDKTKNPVNDVVTKYRNDDTKNPVNDVVPKFRHDDPNNDKPKKAVKKRGPRIKKDKLEADKENVKPVYEDSDTKNVPLYSFMASLADGVPSWRCDSQALDYRNNFKRKRDELTSKLYVLFNSEVYSNRLDSKMPIKWSTSLTTTAGRAYNKLVRSKTSESGHGKSSFVEISCKVVDTAQRLRDTLAHELCHVAAWMLDGQLKDGHGPYWKAWVAKTLARFPELGKISVCHSLTIHYKYTYKCVRCGYHINRHSKSLDTTRKGCGYCGGAFECIINRKTKQGAVVSTPVKTGGPARAPSGFALYVKEHYANARGPYTSHGQVMKYLGKRYAIMKEKQQQSGAGNSSDEGQIR